MAFICPNCKKESSFTICGEQKGYVEEEYTSNGDFDFWQYNDVDFCGKRTLFCNSCLSSFDIGINDTAEDIANGNAEIVKVV